MGPPGTRGWMWVAPPGWLPRAGRAWRGSVLSFSHLLPFPTLPLCSVSLCVYLSVCPSVSGWTTCWGRGCERQLTTWSSHQVPMPSIACFPGVAPYTSGLGPSLWLVNLGPQVIRGENSGPRPGGLPGPPPALTEVVTGAGTGAEEMFKTQPLPPLRSPVTRAEAGGQTNMSGRRSGGLKEEGQTSSQGRRCRPW